MRALVALLLVAYVVVGYTPSDAEVWKASLDYGAGIPTEEASYNIAGLVLSSSEATSLFEFGYRIEGEYIQFPTVGATTVRTGLRALAFTQADLFIGKLANIEFFTSALDWVSSGQSTPKVAVGKSAQVSFWSSLPADVTLLDLTRDTIPADIDVLIINYSDFSDMEQIYQVTINFMSRTEAKGIIIGGNSSHFKWTHYEPCSMFPGTRVLQSAGITFMCDYWGVREKFITPSTFTYLEENLYHAMNYLKDINDRAYTDADVSVLMDAKVLRYMFETVYRGCQCTEDTIAPTSTLYDVFLPLLQGIFSGPGCQLEIPITNEPAKHFCTELVISYAKLPRVSDVEAAITSDIFPGLSVALTTSDLVQKMVSFDTNRCQLQSTGLYALPGVPFTVTIPETLIGILSVQVGIWNGDVHKFNEWMRIPATINPSFDLPTTFNTFATAFGGPIYVNIPCQYMEDVGSLQFDVEFTDAIPALYFVHDQTTESEWLDQLSNTYAPWGEIETADEIFTLPASELAVISYADMVEIAQYWSDTTARMAHFRRQIPDLFKERGIVDVQVQYGYMFAAYPMNGPMSEASNVLDMELAYREGAWGWLHENGHRFERGNSFGPEAGAMWNMFSGNVETFTNVFTCIGVEGVGITDRQRCISNGGKEDTLLDKTFYSGLGPFQKLDFYLMLRDGFTWDAFSETLVRGRTFRFPVNDDNKRTRLWLLLSEQVGRNVGPLFERFGIPYLVENVYEQIILSDLAIMFLRMGSDTQLPGDISEVDNGDLVLSGTVSYNQFHPDRLFSTSTSLHFAQNGNAVITMSVQAQSQLSISFWLFVEQIPSTGAISIIEHSNDIITNWRISLDSSSVINVEYDNAIQVSSSLISTNEWIHIAITADASAISMYLNGIMDNSAIPSALFGQEQNVMLKLDANGEFSGNLAEVSLFDRVLPENRIQAHYAPSPFQFKPWISSQYMPEPLPGCDFIPQGITACHTFSGLFDDEPSICDLCLDHRCNGTPSPDGDCSDVCPPNTIIDAFSGTCFPCHSSCATCSLANDANSCTSCYAESNLPYLQENSCVAECSGSHFLQGDICEPCHSSCASCGPEATDCLSCGSGDVLHDGTCLETCPAGTVERQGLCLDECPPEEYDHEGVCEDCGTTCLTCSVSEDNCLSCNTTGSTPYYTSDTNTCTSGCASGYYHSGNFECLACSSDCHTCQGSADACTSCHTNGTAPYLYFTQCVSECPDHTTTDEELFLCVGCDVYGDLPYNNNGDCVAACDPEQVLHAFHCLNECPEEFFENAESICEECSDNCASCEASPAQCTSCGSSFPILDETQCVVQCPSHKFNNQGVCNLCHSNCTTCAGPNETDCVSCSTDEFLHNGQCLTSCPTRTFGNQGECLECHNSCETCTNDSADACITCPSGNFLDAGRCVSSCGVGRYGDSLSGACEICDLSCATCELQSTYCTSCHEQGEFPIFSESDHTCSARCDTVIHNGECVASCPIGFYKDEQTAVCMACDTSCQSCSGTADKCLTCDAAGLTPFWIESDFSCLSNCRTINQVGFEFECVDRCPPGLRDDGTSLECVSCPDTCLECDSNAACTRCNPLSSLRYLYEGDCVTECPNGFFELPGGHECQSCHSDCASCNGPNFDDCESCEVGFHLESRQCVADTACDATSDSWEIIIRSLETSEAQVTSSMDSFTQEMLCAAGTSHENCIVAGSHLQTLMEVSFELSSSVSCSFACQETSLLLTQAFHGHVDVSQDVYRIVSWIDSEASVFNDFVNEARVMFMSDEVNALYEDAQKRFSDLIFSNSEEICENQLETLPGLDGDMGELSHVELEPIGVLPNSVCDASSAMDYWSENQQGHRCVCDDSVTGMVNPCESIHDAMFMDSNAICHPNHCSSGAVDEFVTIRLDTPYETYSDAQLLQSISILSSWIDDMGLEESRLIRVFRVDRGSVVLTLDVVDSVGNTDESLLLSLYSDLDTGLISMEHDIIEVTISNPDDPVSLPPVSSPVRSPYPLPSKEPSTGAQTQSESDSYSSIRFTSFTGDLSASNSVCLTPLYLCTVFFVLFQLFVLQ